MKRIIIGYPEINRQMLAKLHHQKLNDQEISIVEKIIKSHQKSLEKISNKSTLDFMKYWEPKFHENGENLRRKLLKLVAF